MFWLFLILFSIRFLFLCCLCYPACSTCSLPNSHLMLHKLCSHVKLFPEVVVNIVLECTRIKINRMAWCMSTSLTFSHTCIAIESWWLLLHMHVTYSVPAQFNWASKWVWIQLSKIESYSVNTISGKPLSRSFPNAFCVHNLSKALASLRAQSWPVKPELK